MRFRDLMFGAAAVAILAAFSGGCSGSDADKTGDPNAGIGAAGTPGTNLPQTPEEQYKRQMEEEKAAAKQRKKG